MNLELLINVMLPFFIVPGFSSDRIMTPSKSRQPTLTLPINHIQLQCLSVIHHSQSLTQFCPESIIKAIIYCSKCCFLRIFKFMYICCTTVICNSQAYTSIFLWGNSRGQEWLTRNENPDSPTKQVT